MATRFFEGYQWRLIFTDLSSVTTTWAEGLTTSRKIALALGQASVIDADVNPDDPRVNLVWDDGFTKVAPSKRMIYAFRRDDPTSLSPWRCRAAGICMVIGDGGDVDVPLSHVTAYDPRKLLDARPVLNQDGSFPDPNFGIEYLAQTGNAIVCEMLKATIANDGPVHIDAGLAFGGTALWSGTIETTPVIDFAANAGQMIGEAWSQLEDAGQLDIILDPIYDPINRPGYTHELSIYNVAGTDRHNAVFGWDRMGNSIARIDRTLDAQPGSMFNTVWYHAGSGGPGVPLLGPSVGSGTINGASVTDFGVYWAQQFYPSLTSYDPTGAAVLTLAQVALELAKQGKRVLTLNPIPERAKIPLVEYGLGDRIPVYASRRLRTFSEGLQRVQSIPFDISDDGIENVAGLIVSPDYRGAP